MFTNSVSYHSSGGAYVALIAQEHDYLYTIDAWKGTGKVGLYGKKDEILQ